MFKDRLRSARMHRQITQQRMADAVGIALRSYQQYEQGKSEPPLSALAILSDTLNGPSDWRLCRDYYLESLGVSVDVPRTDPPRRPRPKCSR